MVNPLLFIGTITIALALLLFYYLKSPPRRSVGGDVLRDREAQLRDIIKTIRADYYRRRISQAEANKLLVEYEGELRQVLRKIELSDAINSYPTKKKKPILPKQLTKKRQEIIVLSLLALGILLVAISFVPKEETPAAPLDNNTSTAGDQDYYAFAQAAKKIEEKVGNCSLIKNPLLKDDCFFEASKNESIADGFGLCKRILDPVQKEDCLSSLPLDNVKSIMNNMDMAIEICALLPGADECLMNVSEAVAISNPEKSFEACMEIIPDNKQDDCLYMLGAKLTGWDNKEAVNMCSNIGNNYRRYECMGSVWFNIPHVAVSDLNMSIFVCDNLVIRNHECYDKVIKAFSRLKPGMLDEVCGRLRGDNREECYAAISKPNQSIGKNETIISPANETKNETTAENTTTYELIENCSTGNLSQRDDCIIEIVNSSPILQVPTNESLSLCKNLSTREKRDDCFLALAGSLAQVGKSESIKACIGIESQEKWSICIKNYG